MGCSLSDILFLGTIKLCEGAPFYVLDLFCSTTAPTDSIPISSHSFLTSSTSSLTFLTTTNHHYEDFCHRYHPRPRSPGQRPHGDEESCSLPLPVQPQRQAGRLRYPLTPRCQRQQLPMQGLLCRGLVFRSWQPYRHLESRRQLHYDRHR